MVRKTGLGVQIRTAEIDDILTGIPAPAELADVVEDSIDDANEEVDRGISDTLEGRGYRRSGRREGSIDKSLAERLRIAEKDFARSSQYARYSDMQGLFWMHVGYVPVMDRGNPEKVKKKGYGECCIFHCIFAT